MGFNSGFKGLKSKENTEVENKQEDVNSILERMWRRGRDEQETKREGALEIRKQQYVLNF